MKKIGCVLGLVGLLAGAAYAEIVVNEVLGSTTGTDTEFIELYNSGAAPVDISGWQIQLWDSDSGSSYGGADAGSPYIIPAGTLLAADDYYLMGNQTFTTAYGITPDQMFQENGIENSSYTLILKDLAMNRIDSFFVTDGGAGDSANDAGTPITPEFTFGPDGTFLPAGFYRVGDAGSTLAMLEFGTIPAPSATPGYANLPEPASLVLLSLAALLLRRR